MPVSTNVQNPGDPKSKSTIFEKPLSKTMADKKKELKKRNQRGALIRLFIAVICLGAYSYLFFYTQLTDYLDYENKISQTEKQIQEYEVTLEDGRAIRDTHKAAYDEQFKEEQAVLNTVFPKTTDKIGVIRLLENFATHLNTAFPPFEFTSINFQTPENKEGYTILPFSTSIHASQTNFDRFLGLINLSGNLSTDASEHIRLLDISTISVNYRGVDSSGKDKGVDFNVKLNAYSQS